MDAKTLGQKIKEKYPQYKDMSDEDIGQKMLVKYPQYADVKKDKKGGWIPVAGGIVGGVVGSLLGPAGAAAGAAAGTMGGSVIKSTLFGSQNKEEGDYTGNTKYGFQELSEQGRKNQALEVANAAKDAAIAGATTYVGAKIPGIGPSGKGFLNTVGRVGLKTGVGAGTGAVAGFGLGDIQDTSMKERVSNAKTGAITGGIISGATGTGQEVVNAVKNINKTKLGVDLAKFVEKAKDKTSIDKKIWNKIIEESRKSKKTISNQEIIKNIREKIVEQTGGTGETYDAVIKLLNKENPLKKFTIEQSVKLGARVPFSTSTKGTTALFRNLKKDAISTLVNNKAPNVGDLKTLYRFSKESKKPISWLLKKMVAGTSLIGAGAVGYKVINR